MNITVTDRLIAAALLLLGLCLCVAALCPMVAAYIGLSGDSVRESLLRHDKVGADELRQFMANRQKMAQWQSLSSVYDDLAMAGLDMMDESAHRQQDPDLHQISLWQARALALSPADAYGWLRYGSVLKQSGVANVQVARAAAASLTAAPYEPFLMTAQLSLLLAVQDQLDGQMHAQIPRLAAAAWQTVPEDLVAMAKDNDLVDYIAALLTQHQEDGAAFRARAASVP